MPTGISRKLLSFLFFHRCSLFMSLSVWVLFILLYPLDWYCDLIHCCENRTADVHSLYLSVSHLKLWLTIKDIDFAPEQISLITAHNLCCIRNSYLHLASADIASNIAGVSCRILSFCYFQNVSYIYFIGSYIGQ